MEGQKNVSSECVAVPAAGLAQFFLLLMDSATRTIKAGLDSAPNTWYTNVIQLYKWIESVPGSDHHYRKRIYTENTTFFIIIRSIE